VAGLTCVPLGTVGRVGDERCQVDTTTTRRRHSVNLRWATLGETRALIDGCET
jgi:hypothetical protein